MRRSCSIDRKGRAGRGPRWLGRVGRGSASVPTCGTAHPHQPPELELGELPELIVTWAARLAGTEDALLWLVESEQRQRLLVRCGTGRFAASAGRSLHCGEGLAGRAWQTGAPRAVADYQRWPGRLREPGSQHQLRAALCLPLCRDGDVIDRPGRGRGRLLRPGPSDQALQAGRRDHARAVCGRPSRSPMTAPRPASASRCADRRGPARRRKSVQDPGAATGDHAWHGSWGAPG
jgi:hypothetical protein